MKIALFGKTIAQEHLKDIQSLIEGLERDGDSIYWHSEFKSLLKKNGLEIEAKCQEFNSSKPLTADVDYLFSFGGDGTFLDAIQQVKDKGIPILGINTGRLGFLSNTSTKEIEHAVSCIKNKNYKVEKRSLLQLKGPDAFSEKENFALNEISILKKDTSSMISIDVELDGQFLNTYWADGLIISTATGSTAYSLSCGGPILMPGSGNFVITPIAPHNLNVRPMVISDNSVLEIRVEGRSENHLVALDSRSEELKNHGQLSIQKAAHQISLIQLNPNNFIHSLKSKLNWGLDKRNV